MPPGTGLPHSAQVISVFAVVYGVCQLFYGPLGDRLGKFRIVTWATLFCSLGSMLAIFVHSLGWLVLARMLVALGAAAQRAKRASIERRRNELIISAQISKRNKRGIYHEDRIIMELAG